MEGLIGNTTDEIKWTADQFNDFFKTLGTEAFETNTENKFIHGRGFVSLFLSVSPEALPAVVGQILRFPQGFEKKGARIDLSPQTYHRHQRYKTLCLFRLLQEYNKVHETSEKSTIKNVMSFITEVSGYNEEDFEDIETEDGSVVVSLSKQINPQTPISKAEKGLLEEKTINIDDIFEEKITFPLYGSPSMPVKTFNLMAQITTILSLFLCLVIFFVSEISLYLIIIPGLIVFPNLVYMSYLLEAWNKSSVPDDDESINRSWRWSKWFFGIGYAIGIAAAITIKATLNIYAMIIMPLVFNLCFAISLYSQSQLKEQLKEKNDPMFLEQRSETKRHSFRRSPSRPNPRAFEKITPLDKNIWAHHFNQMLDEIKLGRNTINLQVSDLLLTQINTMPENVFLDILKKMAILNAMVFNDKIKALVHSYAYRNYRKEDKASEEECQQKEQNFLAFIATWIGEQQGPQIEQPKDETKQEESKHDAPTPSSAPSTTQATTASDTNTGQDTPTSTSQTGPDTGTPVSSEEVQITVAATEKTTRQESQTSLTPLSQDYLDTLEEAEKVHFSVQLSFSPETGPQIIYQEEILDLHQPIPEKFKGLHYKHLDSLRLTLLEMQRRGYFKGEEAFEQEMEINYETQTEDKGANLGKFIPEEKESKALLLSVLFGAKTGRYQEKNLEVISKEVFIRRKLHDNPQAIFQAIDAWRDLSILKLKDLKDPTQTYLLKPIAELDESNPQEFAYKEALIKMYGWHQYKEKGGDWAKLEESVMAMYEDGLLMEEFISDTGVFAEFRANDTKTFEQLKSNEPRSMLDLLQSGVISQTQLQHAA